MTAVAKPAPPKPWLSGFCGIDMPDASHKRCVRVREGGVPCKCSCHHESAPVHETPTKSDVPAEHRAVRLLAESIELHQAADEMLTVDLDGIGWEDTVRIAAELKAARAAVGAAEEFLAKHAADVWPAKWRDAQHIEGVGTAQPYRTKDRVKWDHEGLVKKVVEQHMEQAGGEIPDPFTVAGWVTDAAALGYWRVGKLTPLGIEADEYRSSERGTVRLRITGDHMIGDTVEAGE